METCPVCKTESEEIITHDYGERTKVNCPRCGVFEITGTALSMTETRENLWKLSYWIKKGQKIDSLLIIDSGNIKTIIEETEMPKPREQADNLIRWIGENIECPDELIQLKPSNLASVIGTKDRTGVRYVVNYLLNYQLITYEYGVEMLIDAFENNYNIKIGLTFEGWDRYEELIITGSSTRKAFMAMKYGDSELDKFFKENLKEAIKQTGFDLIRLDETLSAGLIDNQLRDQIRNTRFLLADITYDNLGAYWEAGYAEGLGKPVIYLCEKEFFDKFKTHFDTNHHTTIVYDKNDLEKAEENLKATIRATLPVEAKMTDD